jgi:hypothetical protein
MLTVRQHVEQKVPACVQMIGDATKGLPKIPLLEQVIHRVEVGGDEIDSMGKREAAYVLPKKRDIRIADARRLFQHLGGAVDGKHRHAPTPAQIPRKQSGPAAQVGRGAKRNAIPPNQRFKRQPSSEKKRHS